MSLEPRAVSVWAIPCLILGGAALFLTGIFWDTSASIVGVWSRDPLGHGYVVVPAASYLAWTRRDAVRSVRPTTDFWVLPVLAITAFLWLLGNLASTTVIQQFSLVLMFIGLVWGTLGTPVVRPLIWPLGFLLFALPLGDALVPSLQNATAGFVVKALQLTGFPALLQSRVIAIPGSRWEVAAACSGINYLMSALVIAYLYAGLVYQSWRYRAGLMVVSASLAMLANGLRVYITVVVAAFGATGVASGLEHYVVGWLVFASILWAMFAVCRRWPEPPATMRTGLPASVGMRPASPPWRMLVFAITGLALVGVAPVTARRLGGAPNQDAANVPIEISSPWSATGSEVYPWTPKFLDPTAELARTYKNGEHAVRLYVARYDARQAVVKLASQSNTLFSAPWTAVSRASRTAVVGGRSVKVAETVLDSPSGSIIVWNWFVADGTLTDRPLMAQVLLGRSRLFGRGREAAAIAVATQFQQENESAAILQDFVSHLTPFGPSQR